MSSCVLSLSAWRSSPHILLALKASIPPNCPKRLALSCARPLPECWRETSQSTKLKLRRNVPKRANSGTICPTGEVAEWSKAPHSKCGRLETVSRVRISPSPLLQNSPARGIFCQRRGEERSALFVRDSKGGAGPVSVETGARQGRAAKVATAILERLTESLPDDILKLEMI